MFEGFSLDDPETSKKMSRLQSKKMSADYWCGPRGI